MHLTAGTPAGRPRWRWLGLLAVLVVGAHCGIPSRSGAESSAADSARIPDARASLWGEIPPASDSCAVARLHGNSLPAWEATLVYPWRVLTYPIKLVVQGLGAGVVALDGGGALQTTGGLLKRPPSVRGFTPVIIAGGVQGFGLGGTLYNREFLGPDNESSLSYAGSSENFHRASFGVRLGAPSNRQTEFVVSYRYDPLAEYYGLGPTSAAEDESFYAQEMSWAGILKRRPMGETWSGEVELLVSQTRAGGPSSDLDADQPPLAEEFEGDLPAGYGTNSRGVSIGLRLLRNDRRQTGRPGSGWQHRTSLTYYVGTGTADPDYWAFHLEFQRFIPLWFTHRTLALRGLVSAIDPLGATPIPFQRLNINDEPDALRGYPNFRFRDQGLALLNAEYRWPIWADRVTDGAGLDLYLLGDFGQVFAEVDELSLNHLTVSYGGGLRYIGSSGGFGLRLEFARSEEGTQFRLRGSQIFQFLRDGFFRGRNPIPTN